MSREDLIIELEARRRDVVQLKAQVQSLRSNASQLVRLYVLLVGLDVVF